MPSAWAWAKARTRRWQEGKGKGPHQKDAGKGQKRPATVEPGGRLEKRAKNLVKLLDAMGEEP